MASERANVEEHAAPHGVLLTLAYDGTDFAGFQVQPGQRTVQGVVTLAAARVAGHELTLRGVSRTDAGVHAEGQIAAFATHRVLSPERWLLALNRYLPEDVAVRAVRACPPLYEPRFDAVDKLYRYLFHMGPARDPAVRRIAWHIGRLAGSAARNRGNLDCAAMRKAARELEGTHDFRAFRASADARPNTRRTLTRVALIEAFHDDPQLLALEVQGTAFMMNMVRIIAGTLLDVGRGEKSASDVRAMLSQDAGRQDAGMTAPAHGLTLVAVNLGRPHAAASR